MPLNETILEIAQWLTSKVCKEKPPCCRRCLGFVSLWFKSITDCFPFQMFNACCGFGMWAAASGHYSLKPFCLMQIRRTIYSFQWILDRKLGFSSCKVKVSVCRVSTKKRMKTRSDSAVLVILVPYIRCSDFSVTHWQIAQAGYCAGGTCREIQDDTSIMILVLNTMGLYGTLWDHDRILCRVWFWPRHTTSISDNLRFLLLILPLASVCRRFKRYLTACFPLVHPQSP